MLHEVVEDGPVAADGIADVADALAVELDHLGAAARAYGDDLASSERLGDGRAGGGEDLLRAAEQRPVHVKGYEAGSSHPSSPYDRPD